MTKLIEGIKLKGRPAMIPDCDRSQLPIFLKEMGLKVGAEIGVYKGAYTALFCKVGLRVFAIDPWVAHSGTGRRNRYQERQDFLYEHTQRTLAPYPNCTIVRKTSMEAIKDFEDNSLDFVYIDGNHSFKYIVEDIWEWSKKVKKGGIISGHDYALKKYDNPRDVDTLHVKFAVDAYTKAFNIENWWVLGREEIIKGEKRDDFRSWMFIKE